jgi:type I restriction enzyme M protein
MEIFANEILKQDKISFREIKLTDPNGQQYIDAIREESLEKLGYFLRPDELFSEVAKRGNSDVEGINNFILEDLQKILTNIQLSTMGTESEEDFDNLFEDMDLNSTKLGKKPEDRNEIISKVLSHLDKIDFQLEDTELDVLGDAYEYLIGQFASGAGKKAGEFYTPQEVSTILAKIVTTGKTKLKSAYDPTSGSGSLLLRIARQVKEVGNFYGQENNRTTYNLCRMNMILHGVHYKQFDIKQEDTLEHPQHLGMTFEAIVANPPFSAQWSANPLFTTDDRFSQYGKLAPSSKADFAFVQHMIHHLSENGIMALVLPHGALFRSGSEQHIRRYLIENRNYLDAVIGLPANIFYGTSIPTCIMVFKKCKEHPDDVLFIDASQHFEKVKTQNVLREEHIDKIIDTYRNRTEEEKYSKRVTLQLIADNDYNLNIPRYIDIFEEEEIIDINEICDLLEKINNLSIKNDEKIFSICYELNIPKPIGNNIFLLEQYKKGMMKRIFSQELRFKDNDGNVYPDWEEKKLGEIFYSEKGKGISKNKIVPNGNFECVLYGELYTKYNEVIYNVVSKTNEVDGIKSKVGDLLIPSSTTTTGIDLANVTALNKNDVLLGGDITVLRTDNEINNVFYAYYLSNHKKEEIASYAQGSTIVHLYYSHIKDMEIHLLSLSEQIKIANFLSAIDDKINHCKEQIVNTEVWKKGLLQQMFV